MLERDFQFKLKKDIEEKIPGSIVLKNDANNIQGFPDLLILYKKKWAALECKRSKKAHKQPNQEYYVKLLNKMSYAKFITPENREEIIDEIQKSFGLRRNTRIHKCK